MMSSMAKPFIRWAGGKQKLWQKLAPFFQIEYSNYVEPFIGAGSVFFSLNKQPAVISDLNADLINTYNTIKKNYSSVYKYLEVLNANHSEENYYLIRNEYNNHLGKNGPQQAARFIYLIQSSFNGIYRVNKNGFYNVPFGKENPKLPSKEDLCLVSNSLKNTTILNCDYHEVADYINKNILCYLDPSYPELSDTAYFTHYTKERFTSEDHYNLYEFIQVIDKKKAKIILSIADTMEVREMYKEWNIYSILSPRPINCKKTRISVSELVITNYEVDYVF